MNTINPIIQKYMNEQSIDILLDKKNIFIAKENFDITQKIIDLINKEIKNFIIK
jgi:Skp family chaperone for outer membrane proteins